MKKEIKEVAVQAQSTVAVGETITLSLPVYNFETGEEKNKKILVSMDNIRDKSYFISAANYINLAATKTEAESLLSDIQEKLSDETTPTKDIPVLKAKATVIEGIKSLVSGKIADYVSVADKAKVDLFCKAVVAVVNPLVKKQLPTTGVAELEAVLKKTKDLKPEDFKGEIRKEVREAVNGVFLNYATTESQEYTNSRVNCNSAMADDIYRRYFGGWKRKKAGELERKFLTTNGISGAVVELLVSKLQKKLYLEED